LFWGNLFFLAGPLPLLLGRAKPIPPFGFFFPTHPFLCPSSWLCICFCCTMIESVIPCPGRPNYVVLVFPSPVHSAFFHISLAPVPFLFSPLQPSPLFSFLFCVCRVLKPLSFTFFPFFSRTALLLSPVVFLFFFSPRFCLSSLDIFVSSLAVFSYEFVFFFVCSPSLLPLEHFPFQTTVFLFT